MARNAFDPRDFGIEMAREAFDDELINSFNTFSRGGLTIDELVLHPREALEFCDRFRRGHGFLYLPDDVILRTLMNIRKRGGQS